MQRKPVVAGQFYDSNPGRVYPMVDRFLGLAEEKRTDKTILVMAPHAGYVFSGPVCGKTLATANLESTILMLGPNHTGLGERFSLWPGGQWDIPGGSVPVDEELAAALLGGCPQVQPDTDAHVREHSLEVILPFLKQLNSSTTIVPIAISAFSFDDLQEVGKDIGRVLKEFERPVSIVVSSDMSHMISEDEAKQLDSVAIEAAVALDPHGLFTTVRQNNITMCGVLPMTVGLFAALELGATKGELIAYATSGAVTGDYDKVVGYAGVLVS